MPVSTSVEFFSFTILRFSLSTAPRSAALSTADALDHNPLLEKVSNYLAGVGNSYWFPSDPSAWSGMLFAVSALSLSLSAVSDISLSQPLILDLPLNTLRYMIVPSLWQ
jgi:hypothetical protein